MATAFEVGLQNFQKYADTISPEFSRAVQDVIATNYVSTLQGGFGLVDTGSTSSAAERTVSKLTDVLNAFSGTYLKTMEAYYTTKGKIADLKLQAKGNLVTQTYNAMTPAPQSLLLWAGLGVGALLLLTRK